MSKLDKVIQEKDRRKPEQVQMHYKKSTPPSFVMKYKLIRWIILKYKKVRKNEITGLHRMPV